MQGHSERSATGYVPVASSLHFQGLLLQFTATASPVSISVGINSKSTAAEDGGGLMPFRRSLAGSGDVNRPYIHVQTLLTNL
ncbi:hypothetical protein MJO28_003433 [Puccinia striiformis f. sp. tritici]|uniref:Uncharacterized protein n=1 Tax=Puccinia striiformis f. sp. tritici TaxID=168172 RepID=A0ACC0ET54_9BASI|nr:hypothetical protein MJO28_003433 [Puccinia striiformis f. sp. tritici]